MTESKGITCKLRNGTEVLLSEGDRVLALRMVKDGMPITVDADYIIDEVLATLAEAQQVNTVFKEALEAIWSNSDDQGAIECATDALDTVRLIGKLKVGEKVVQKSTGTEGVLIDIQYEHNRYQFADVSGWMYHISDLETALGEEVES
ncbi:hypothetical protein J2T13_000845 [Paenibacillus sp. DS2015]|uniref:hypothetical protein n=1 Tax=Paenibacillus sp. DS2015 TaxID=3373917 RepID=UPI003D1C4A9B